MSERWQVARSHPWFVADGAVGLNTGEQPEGEGWQPFAVWDGFIWWRRPTPEPT